VRDGLNEGSPREPKIIGGATPDHALLPTGPDRPPLNPEHLAKGAVSICLKRMDVRSGLVHLLHLGMGWALTLVGGLIPAFGCVSQAEGRLEIF
jgi:hypothetical protein